MKTHWDKPSHFICSADITDVLAGYIVSTVGDYWPKFTGQREHIGCERFYETMVFRDSGKRCDMIACPCGGIPEPLDATRRSASTATKPRPRLRPGTRPWWRSTPQCRPFAPAGSIVVTATITERLEDTGQEDRTMTNSMVLSRQDQLDVLKRTLCGTQKDLSKELTNDEFALFVEICKHTGLDPFRKQIYAVKRGGRLVPQTSIDGYRVIAERSGKYAGQVGPFWCGEDGNWLDVWIDSKPPKAAKVGVLRSDFKEPLWGVARFDSYKGDNLWNKMPEVMIAKCAEALAIRRAFPDEVAGVYTKEEMEQADVQAITVVSDPVDPIEQAALSTLPDFGALIESATTPEELTAVGVQIHAATAAKAIAEDKRKSLGAAFLRRKTALATNGASACSCTASARAAWAGPASVCTGPGPSLCGLRRNHRARRLSAR